VSHYDVLGVAADADAAALHAAYVVLARRHHPDLVGGDTARMRVINEAWAALSDPVRRASYDRSLAAATIPAPRPAPPAGRSDADDLAADLDDDRPVHPVTVRLPRWLSLLPVTLFAASIGSGFVGLVFASEEFLGLALMAFVLSCLSFLAAPFVALFAARTGRGQETSRQ
jgi:curved DNA-binding protein CbpA